MQTAKERASGRPPRSHAPTPPRLAARAMVKAASRTPAPASQRTMSALQLILIAIPIQLTAISPATVLVSPAHTAGRTIWQPKLTRGSARKNPTGDFPRLARLTRQGASSARTARRPCQGPVYTASANRPPKSIAATQPQTPPRPAARLKMERASRTLAPA